jgi:predicted CoA-binding protein
VIDETYSEDEIRAVLTTVKRIAMVGASANPARPSYFVMKYLTARGYDVTPINPGLAGGEILGRPVAGTLAGAKAPFDMIDVFRNSEAAGAVVAEALALEPKPKVIWMQLGVSNAEAARLARAAGLTVIMNRCPKIEYARLSGEIGWSGVNSGIVSAKRPTMGQSVQRLDISVGAKPKV